jgi:metallo-beta-lactamase family protein
MIRLTFLGAAGEVTGSCYLVECGDLRFLVDCGQFQGGRESDRKNREALDFDPRTLDFVLLTHAHLDHCGLIPRLVAFGYRKEVHATHATVDLMRVMLKDSAHIHEKDAERENRHRRRERLPFKERKKSSVWRDVAPLYTVLQAEESLRYARGHRYDDEFKPHPRVRVKFRDAGHILGAASLEVWVQDGAQEKKLVFSGDLGQPGHPLVNDPAVISSADVLLVESTYGNRLHKNLESTLNELVEAVQTTFAAGGNLLVPAFALGRTQDLIVLLRRLQTQGRLPRLNVFIDSPLAQAATEITVKHAAGLDDYAQCLAAANTHDGFNLRFLETPQDSMSLNTLHSGAIIIAGSGMCEGGRIRHHLRYQLPRRECGVLFTGYQAAGTLGRKIVDGAHSVRIFNEEVPVRARKFTLGGLSAHADQAALLEWLSHFDKMPGRVFVVHGEQQTARLFCDAINSRLSWAADIPALGQTASF